MQLAFSMLQWSVKLSMCSFDVNSRVLSSRLNFRSGLTFSRAHLYHTGTLANDCVYTQHNERPSILISCTNIIIAVNNHLQAVTGVPQSLCLPYRTPGQCNMMIMASPDGEC